MVRGQGRVVPPLNCGDFAVVQGSISLQVVKRTGTSSIDYTVLAGVVAATMIESLA